MNTFIISSKSENRAISKINEILNEYNVNKFDREVLKFEKALGIADVRNIQKNIYLKPFKGARKSIILILKKGATIEAQNSLLKLLEEPPKSSLIFIVSENHQSFLPTILSRVKVIELKNEFNYGYEEINQIKSIKNSGDALYLAQTIYKDKNEALKWLERAILATRENMLLNLDNKSTTLKLLNQTKNLEKYYLDLKNTNVNTRLALENLFLNI